MIALKHLSVVGGVFRRVPSPGRHGSVDPAGRGGGGGARNRTACRLLPSPFGLSGVRRAGFTLIELLVVMSIMLAITTILVAGYFGMTRAASYTAAESGIYNLLQLARQRACMDGTKVFFLLIDSNSCVLVHGVGELTSDMQKSDGTLRYNFYDAYADHHIVTNDNSKLRVWNMDKNLYGDDVTIESEIKNEPIPGGGGSYMRQANLLDLRVPRAADAAKWEVGDRYGFELYPRQMLPKGFFFGLQNLDTFPDNDKIVFAADGSSSRISSDGTTFKTGTTKLYLYEKIARETSRAIQIEIKNPDATIVIKTKKL